MQLTGEGGDCSFGASLLIASCDGRGEYGQKVELRLVGVVLRYCEHSQHEALGLRLASKIVSSFERWIYLEQFSLLPASPASRHSRKSRSGPHATPENREVVCPSFACRARESSRARARYQRGAAARKDRVKLDLPVDLRSPLRVMNNCTTTWAVSGTVSQARD